MSGFGYRGSSLSTLRLWGSIPISSSSLIADSHLTSASTTDPYVPSSQRAYAHPLAVQAALTSLGISSTGSPLATFILSSQRSDPGEYLLSPSHALQFSSGRHFLMFTSALFLLPSRRFQGSVDSACRSRSIWGSISRAHLAHSLGRRTLNLLAQTCLYPSLTIQV
jgi:hypothetical protein